MFPNFFLYPLIIFFLSSCSFEELKDIFPEEKRELISEGLPPKDLYFKAQESIDAGAINEALKTFAKLRAAYPSSKYSLQSEIDSIYSLYKYERYDEAISMADDLLRRYPNHFSSPYIMYMKGIISEDKSRSILDNYITDNAQRDVSTVLVAFRNYLALIDKFPKSEYSEEAKSRLVVIRNILARHELFVAIFYTKKGGYIASINRCKYIIENYPNTPSVPAALHLIAHNYDKINAPKLAEDARRVLNASYPKYTPHYSLED